MSKDVLEEHELDGEIKAYRKVLLKIAELENKMKEIEKSCDNCGRYKDCTYENGECVGLDLVRRKWIPK